MIRTSILLTLISAAVCMPPGSKYEEIRVAPGTPFAYLFKSCNTQRVEIPKGRSLIGTSSKPCEMGKLCFQHLLGTEYAVLSLHPKAEAGIIVVSAENERILPAAIIVKAANGSSTAPSVPPDVADITTVEADKHLEQPVILLYSQHVQNTRLLGNIQSTDSDAVSAIAHNFTEGSNAVLLTDRLENETVYYTFTCANGEDRYLVVVPDADYPSPYTIEPVTFTRAYTADTELIRVAPWTPFAFLFKSCNTRRVAIPKGRSLVGTTSEPCQMGKLCFQRLTGWEYAVLSAHPKAETGIIVVFPKNERRPPAAIIVKAANGSSTAPSVPPDVVDITTIEADKHLEQPVILLYSESVQSTRLLGNIQSTDSDAANGIAHYLAEGYAAILLTDLLEDYRAMYTFNCANGERRSLVVVPDADYPSPYTIERVAFNSVYPVFTEGISNVYPSPTEGSSGAYPMKPWILLQFLLVVITSKANM